MAPATWFRKIVPAGYEQATLMLTGTAPLLMKAGDFDPDSDEYRSFELLGVQPRKSLDERQRLRELEWTLALYMDEQFGPVVPAKNIHELLREAATKWRKGAEVTRSLVITEFRVPLNYEGPRDQDGLWEQGFRYTTMAANGGVTVAGCSAAGRCSPAGPSLPSLRSTQRRSTSTCSSGSSRTRRSTGSVTTGRCSAASRLSSPAASCTRQPRTAPR